MGTVIHVNFNQQPVLSTTIDNPFVLWMNFNISLYTEWLKYFYGVNNE